MKREYKNEFNEEVVYKKSGLTISKRDNIFFNIAIRFFMSEKEYKYYGRYFSIKLFNIFYFSINVSGFSIWVILQIFNYHLCYSKQFATNI